MESKTISYDGLELKLYYWIQEGNKGDGYITPNQRDYLVLDYIKLVGSDGVEYDISNLVGERTRDYFDELLNEKLWGTETLD